MDKEILKKVYDLAKIKHINYLNEETSNISKSIIENINKRQECELFQYLNHLTYEQNLMILAITYIGRGDCNEKFNKNKDVKDIYEFMLNYVRDTFPNNEVTISQIYGKASLDEYLKKGFELLEIKI